jgi:hypothetical protein
MYVFGLSGLGAMTWTAGHVLNLSCTPSPPNQVDTEPCLKVVRVYAIRSKRKIRRPPLVRGHQAVGNEVQSSLINPVHPLVHLSTYPEILNLLFSCLFPSYPPDPQNRCQNHGAPVCSNSPGPRDPPNRARHPSTTGQNPPKRVGCPPNRPRWHPKMAKFSPRTPQNLWDILQIHQDGTPRWPS